MSSSLKYLLFYLTSTSILWQCASIQSPSGGEKDLYPPKVLDTSPKQGAVNVNPSSIEIKFDEFFVLNNFSNELLISPPLNKKPFISQKGKSLILEFQEELKKDRTYTLNFGKGIADLHEGNVLENYTLVFSTGLELDSLSMTGLILPCPANELPNRLIVAAYEKNLFTKDSTIFLTKANYFSVPDEHGHFSIEKMKVGNYELIAFDDINANYQFDGLPEKIGFHPNSIHLNNHVNTNIWLYKQEDELKVLDRKSGPTHFKWVLNKNIDTYKIHTSPVVEYYSRTVDDSLFIWPKQINKDSLQLVLNIEDTSDTVIFKPIFEKGEELHIIPPSNNFIKKNKNYTCFTTSPIKEIDASKIKLQSGGVSKELIIHQGDFKLAFEFEFEENLTYNLTIENGALKGLYNEQNQETNLTFFTKAANSLASLKINLVSKPKAFFIELLKEGVVQERISSEEPLFFSNLLPDHYELRLVLDTNKDGNWTAGSYFDNRLPEEVHYYSKDLNLRANWELEIDWELEIR